MMYTGNNGELSIRKYQRGETGPDVFRNKKESVYYVQVRANLRVDRPCSCHHVKHVYVYRRASLKTDSVKIQGGTLRIDAQGSTLYFCTGFPMIFAYNTAMEHPKTRGHFHPISILIDDIARIFTDMGFDIEDGPELETEYYNFDALNVPKDHPSRDMQDTFWIKPSPTDTERRLLRTHTSPVQIRYMETKMKAGIEPPYAIVVPGKVFRNEATDATHEAQFFQVEGLLVGKDVTLGMLKGVLGKFFSELFGGETAGKGESQN